MSTVRLGDICQFINGGAWTQSEFSDSGYPVLKVSNCKPSGFVLDDVSYIPLDIAEKSEINKLYIHDVIIATVGSHPNLVDSAAGRSCIVTEEVCGYYLNQNAVCLRTLDDNILNQRYLGFLTQYFPFQHYIQNKGKGAANQMRIAISAIKDYAFELPEISIQNRVANILSTYDDLIENNQKQIKLLEEAAQRLYKEWFVDLRFPGYENTPIIDGVPQGWSWKSILKNDIFKFVSSRVLPFDGVKTYYATADVTGTNIVSSGEKITFDNKPSRAAIQPVLCSVWFARMSNSYKILNCFGENAWMAKSAILSSGFAGFSSKVEFYGFVYQTIASEYFNEEKDRYATGATQVSLTNDGLAKINVLIPSEHIVVQYSKLVEPIMYKTELLKNENFKLKEARDRLLPKLMSGELEV